ncbi:hypothetical protein [Lacticaseibacillus paracasei]|uniref:hypothetical protein n=1 Tax=Lacticaseibacillus paracasei TaxID=1597 RepID=UPI0033911ECE
MNQKKKTLLLAMALMIPKTIEASPKANIELINRIFTDRLRALEIDGCSLTLAETEQVMQIAGFELKRSRYDSEHIFFNASVQTINDISLQHPKAVSNRW